MICVGCADGVGGVWWLVAVTSLSAHTVSAVPSQACHTASGVPGQSHHWAASTQHQTLGLFILLGSQETFHSL